MVPWSANGYSETAVISTGSLDRFAVLEDPRQSWKTVCPLPEILLILLCGRAAGVIISVLVKWACFWFKQPDPDDTPPMIRG